MSGMPRSRRLACRFGLHDTVTLGPGLTGQDVCLYQWTCRRCEHVTRSALIHEYGDDRLTDPCHGVRACERCEDELPVTRHDYRWTPLRDLPADRRPRPEYWQQPSVCDEVQVCRTCGERCYSRTAHVFDREGWGASCRRCGERWLVNDA
jgi:hypothetical protein